MQQSSKTPKPYVPFFSKANVIIAEYKALLDSRKTRSENKKDEQTEQE